MSLTTIRRWQKREALDKNIRGNNYGFFFRSYKRYKKNLSGETDYELGYKDGKDLGFFQTVEQCMDERRLFRTKNNKMPINIKEKYIEGFRRAISDLEEERQRAEEERQRAKEERQRAGEEERQRAINALEVEREENYNKNKHRYALTCRKCGKDALPVAGTECHYNCSSCGNKFTGAKHPF